MRTSQITALFTGLLSAILFAPLFAQGPDALSSGSEWTQYRGNLAGTGFSPLTQINQDNVANLDSAWSYSLLATAL